MNEKQSVEQNSMKKINEETENLQQEKQEIETDMLNMAKGMKLFATSFKE
jgi:hypothetical protein